MKAPKIFAAVCAVSAGLFAVNANATTYCGSSGSLAACADFTITGSGQLQVVLTNTSTFDVLDPADVLTGVFFNSSGLTPVSAVLTSGSTVFYDPDGQPAGGVVGGEWAYGSGLVGAPSALNSGISSSGLGLFGNPNFPGPDLASPTAVDGVQYGILSAGDNTATGNGGITGSGGLIKNSVTFILGVPTGFNLNSLGSFVVFQYGTALTEPSVGGCLPGTTGCRPPDVPEPGTLALLGLGLLGLGMSRRRKA